MFIGAELQKEKDSEMEAEGGDPSVTARGVAGASTVLDQEARTAPQLDPVLVDILSDMEKCKLTITCRCVCVCEGGRGGGCGCWLGGCVV